MLLSLISTSSCSILLSKEQLEILLSSICLDPSTFYDFTSSDETFINYQWACHGIQTFFINLVTKEKTKVITLVDEAKEKEIDLELANLFQKVDDFWRKGFKTAADEENEDQLTDMPECNDNTMKSDGGVDDEESLISSQDITTTEKLFSETSLQELNAEISKEELNELEEAIEDKIFGKLTLTDSSDQPKPKPKVLKKSTSSTYLLSKDLHQTKKVKLSPEKKENSVYNNCIISNTIDSRFLSDIQLPAELHLQVMARDMYKCSLNAIKFAKPNISEVDSENIEKSNAADDTEPNIELLSMLLEVLEEVFNKSNSIDVHNFLLIWNDLCCIILKGLKRRHLISVFSSKTDSSLFSTATIEPLLDLILDARSTDVQLQYAVLSLLHNHIKVCCKINGKKLNINKSKLATMLTQCSTMEVSQESKDHNVIFGKLLTRLSGVTICSEGEVSRGACLLLNVLVKVLKERLELLYIQLNSY